MQTAQHTKHIVFDKHSSGISDGLKQVAYESKNGGASVVSEEGGGSGSGGCGQGTAGRQISLLPPRWRHSYHTAATTNKLISKFKCVQI